MSTPLPISFASSPLPSNFKGTIQQCLDAYTARLSIIASDQLSFFSTASIAPTSNVGPWLNGQSWMVWDNTTGGYIPLVLSSVSLEYIVSLTAPDPNVYTFWIQVDINGQPIAIKYYYNGTWTDIYASQFANYSTTAQMNSAIASALAANQVKISMNSNQSIVVNASTHQCQFNDVLIDPKSNFNASTWLYTAPVAGTYHVDAHGQLDNAGADSTTIEFSFRTGVNGNATLTTGVTTGVYVPLSPYSNLRWYPSLSGLISLNAGDTLGIYLSGTDSAGIYGAGQVVMSNASLDIFFVSSTQ